MIAAVSGATPTTPMIIGDIVTSPNVKLKKVINAATITAGVRTCALTPRMSEKIPFAPVKEPIWSLILMTFTNHSVFRKDVHSICTAATQKQPVSIRSSQYLIVKRLLNANATPLSLAMGILVLCAHRMMNVGHLTPQLTNAQ